MRNRIILILLVCAIVATITIVIVDINKGKVVNNKANTNDEKTNESTLQKRTIAIIDSGANLENVNYDKKLKITKYNVLDGSENITDNSKRGTMVFSALYNDIYSMNKDNDVMLIKAFDNYNDIKVENIVKAIDYACDNQAGIINLSFNLKEDAKISSSIKKCETKNIPVISSEKKNELTSYPAILSNVISVSLSSSKAKTDVKVDDKMQRVCVANKCNSNHSVDLSSAYVTGYLSDFKDFEKEIKNLVIMPSYSINKVTKK